MWFYGCWGEERGHYLHARGGERVYRHEGILLPNRLDATLAPGCRDGGRHCPVEQPEGVTALHHIDGHTVLAMWDRSVDRRPNSNVAFVQAGRLSEGEMWAVAEREFPQVVARLKAYEAWRAKGA